jgi:UDP-N-acetylmuramyl pentapeptide phosphotransferase/UDP-N-acetylglucosamine-1-phosphate transferase
MFGFLFRSATYYILWQKFQKQIILVTLSLISISIIFGIYDDLFKVLKVNNKDSLIVIFIFKWIFVSLIIFYNIYKLKQVKIEDTNDVIQAVKNDEKKIYPQNVTNVLRKKQKLTTTTDLILKRYKK